MMIQKEKTMNANEEVVSRRNEAEIEIKKKEISNLNNISMEEYQLLFDNLIYARIVLDENLKLVLMNKTFREAFEINQEDIEKKEFISLFNDNLGLKIIAKAKELQEETKKENKRINFEAIYRAENKTEKLYTISLLFFENINKIVIRFVDITEQRKTEDELKRKNIELFQLYELSKTLQQTLDLDETLDIAIKTFTQLGFDRVRIYFYDDKEHMFYGKKANDITFEKFKGIKVPITSEHSKVYHCFTQKTPIIRKEEKDNYYSKVLQKKGVYESASLPLVNKEHVLGMISLDNKYSKKKIPEESLPYLMTFVNQISVAIENSLLYASSIRRLNRLSTIYDIAKLSSTTFDLELVLNQIVLRITKIIAIDFCSILILDEEKKMLIPEIAYAVSKGKISVPPLKLQDSISGEVISTKKTMYIKEVLKEEKYAYKMIAENQHLKSMLCIPLMVDNIAIGTLSVYNKKIRRFSQDEINLLEALADHAAIIVKKTELYNKIIKDNENFSLLIEMGRVLNSTLKTDDLLRLCLEKTVEFTKADFGFILILEDNVLRFKYTKGYSQTNVDKIQLRVGEGVSGYAALIGMPVIINNVEQESKYIKINEQTKSEAAIPIMRNSKVIAVLDLESNSYNNFSKYSQALQLLTNQIAVAIENANLYDEISLFNEKLKHEIEVATRELREKNKELEKMDKLKSDFVSNVSHELRTPLTSIKGYTQLLYEEKIGPIDEKQKQCLKIVLEESDRLTRLINEVLDLSKLEHGKVRFKLEKVNISEIANLVINTMTMIAEEKKIIISNEFEKELPIIPVSKDLIKQVFINLIGNAIKFTKKEGKIHITIKKINDYIQVSVKDSCNGIPKEALPNIFSKFYQVDSSMTREHSGTGLGLAIARHIVEIHQGEIRVESEENKGCLFTFTLPLKRERKNKLF